MASGENPVTTISADGLPTELVVLATASDPVTLQPHLNKDGSAGLVQPDEEIRSLGEDADEEGHDVEFCQSVEEEGISMVSDLPQFGNSLDVTDRNVNESMIVQW